PGAHRWPRKPRCQGRLREVEGGCKQAIRLNSRLRLLCHCGWEEVVLILVVGSTGRLGGMITRRLPDRGEAVRILVRPNSRCQELVDAGVWPILGDLRERSSLDDVMAVFHNVETGILITATQLRAVF
ncbi:MAG: NmrA family NAD(P)-binding protein, partial [Thermoplasmata archaeon]